MFELQAKDLRDSILERAIEEEQRRMSQASRVFLREERNTGPEVDGEMARASVKAVVVNSSDLPVYDANLSWQRYSAKKGNPSVDYLGTIMPAGESCSSREFMTDAEMHASSAVLTFRDAAGVTWVCRPDGTLKDADTEQRASGSLSRKAAGLVTREVRDLVMDYLARSNAGANIKPEPKDATRLAAPSPRKT